MIVIKRDGTQEKFQTDKTRNWVRWAVKDVQDQVEAEYYILQETLKRLPPKVTTEEIHQTMIQVCLDKEEIEYSRIAANLEKATLYKNLESAGVLSPQTSNFDELLGFFVRKGIWKNLIKNATDEQVKELNELYIELEAVDLEYWTIKQWSDKYSKKLLKEPCETPAMGAIGIALGLHGITDLAFDVARDIIGYKVNYPTPLLNGIRDGSTDSISCCVIEGGDEVASLDIASYVASRMTAKKAGIGITLDTRSQGDPVKGGQVTHLGKAPLYMAVEKEVKKFTQISRGGSATMTYKVIDPDVMSMFLWKTQRIDVSQRIDKIDYSLAYNDAFLEAVINNQDWYLFSRHHAPEVHRNFHKEDYMDFVRAALERNAPHKKVKAWDILREFGKARWETGRLYCINVTRANEHTPFTDEITQSNLCMEIALPTRPFYSMEDFMNPNGVGEVAFCSIAAINVSHVDLDEYFAVAERVLRTVDRMIELADGISPNLTKKLKDRRSAGIGITGLAGYLYKQGLDYDGSYKSLVQVEQLAATHYYSLLQASQKMSKETGFCVEGVKLDWLPIDTAKPVTDVKDWELDYDWEALRGKPRMHSVLVAHMPCESSSAFSNSTNGLYPTRKKVIYKKARVGKVQFIVPEYTEDKMSVWDVNMVPYYQAVQNSTDQGISSDYYTDFTKYAGKKVPETDIFKWFLSQGKAGIKTAYYQNFRDVDAEKASQFEKEDESCESGACKL